MSWGFIGRSKGPVRNLEMGLDDGSESIVCQGEVVYTSYSKDGRPDPKARLDGLLLELGLPVTNTCLPGERRKTGRKRARRKPPQPAHAVSVPVSPTGPRRLRHEKPSGRR